MLLWLSTAVIICPCEVNSPHHFYEGTKAGSPSVLKVCVDGPTWHKQSTPRTATAMFALTTSTSTCRNEVPKGLGGRQAPETSLVGSPWTPTPHGQCGRLEASDVWRGLCLVGQDDDSWKMTWKFLMKILENTKFLEFVGSWNQFHHQ